MNPRPINTFNIKPLMHIISLVLLQQVALFTSRQRTGLSSYLGISRRPSSTLEVPTCSF